MAGAGDVSSGAGGLGATPRAGTTTPRAGAGGGVPDCGFSGTPRIEPEEAEISGPQQFTLTGIGLLPPGCVRWSISPSSFPIFSAEGDARKVDFDQKTGRLSPGNTVPNDRTLRVSAIVADEIVAGTSVHYYDPQRALDGVFSEVGVLRCVDYVEEPRESIQEIFLTDGFMVTFTAIETYVDYSGQASVTRDPSDPRRGSISFTVDEENSNQVPETLATEGTYRVRPDGYVELRDLWLGPDATLCGHVLERRDAVLR